MSVAYDLFPAVREGVEPDLPVRPRLRLVPSAAPADLDVEVVIRGDVPSVVPLLAPPAGGAVAAPVRLTRRGVVVVAALVAAVAGALVWLAAASVPAAAPHVRVPATVTVQAGDTLWSIASRYANGRDTGAVVDQLEVRNHIADGQVIPGQVLVMN